MGIANAELAERMRRPADALLRSGRSALYEVLMRGAADDLAGGGVVAELLADVPTPPGSVSALRLMAALHRVVLAGDAAELAGYYPSAGGQRAPDGAWPVAAAVLRDRLERIHDLLGLRMQTKEPGYAAALYGGLSWLTERHELPICLLQLGASAGLHLTVDRFRSAGQAATTQSPLAWLVMGPGRDAVDGFRLTATTWPDGHTTQLADTGVHGLPVRWHPRCR